VLALWAGLGVNAAEASSLSLGFDSPGGTVRDAAGVGTGLTARLAGSGGNITGNDPNLRLRPAAGVLQVRTSPGADFNGQAGWPTPASWA
jgi:hypothetical protein